MRRCKLFEPLTIRGITLKNRIAVSPMCQYSSQDGSATDWHLVHLGSRAVGGAGLVICEATAVEARGRISPDDMGIWNDRHIEPFKRITEFVQANGSVAGIQLAHAGRKASTMSPWKDRKVISKQEGGWDVVGPSPVPFSEKHPMPHELSEEEIGGVVDAFQAGARRAVAAGFKIVEIHNAHGYLLHSFLSPLSNKRQDKFGGNLENRMRLSLMVAEAVRKEIPDDMPLFLRISSTDWADGGWDLEQSVELAKRLKDAGVDLIDCSSGMAVPYARPVETPGFQVPFAREIRKQCGIKTGAVGMITEPGQADEIIENGDADIVLLARELLRDPYWPLHAADALGVEVPWPDQYLRGRERPAVK